MKISRHERIIREELERERTKFSAIQDRIAGIREESDACETRINRLETLLEKGQAGGGDDGGEA